MFGEMLREKKSSTLLGVGPEFTTFLKRQGKVVCGSKGMSFRTRQIDQKGDIRVSPLAFPLKDWR